MPFTTGNDTVNFAFDGTNIDGLAGDDLLVFSAPASYLGRQTFFFQALLPGENGFIRLGFWQFIPLATEQVIISRIERLDLSTPLGAIAHLTTSIGNDTLRGADQDDVLKPGGGANYVYGGGGNDFIELMHGNGIDRVQGGAGNDTISGAGLDDYIDGGTGYDLMTFSFATSAVPVSIDTETYTTNIRWRNFEAFEFNLTEGNDTLRATNIVEGFHARGGDDLLILDRTGLAAFRPALGYYDPVTSGFDRVQFHGSAFDDQVRGTNGNDTLSGADGNDTLIALEGQDQVFGGPGDDVIEVFGRTDIVDGGAGFDILVVDFTGATEGMTLGRGQSPVNWTGIEAYLGSLTRHDDIYYVTLLSNSGAPFPGAARNINFLSGGRGTDLLVFDYSFLGREWTGTVVDMRPGTGQNVVQYSVVGSVSCRVTDWEMIDYTGSRYADRVFGAIGDDTIRGGDGNDTLDGGLGNNLLYGGNGDDVMNAAQGTTVRAYGADGNDSFSLFDVGNVIDGGLGRDTVTVNFNRAGFASGVTLTQRGVDNRWSGIEDVNGVLSQRDDIVRMGAMGTGEGTLSGGLGSGPVILLANVCGV